MTVLLPLLCGLLTGVLSAWGVGGGTLLLLCMTLFLNVDQQTAQGINLLYFLPTAAGSLFLHGKHGYLDREALGHAAPWAAVTALLSAAAALYLDVSLLRKPFGLLLLYAGLSLLFSKKEK